MKKWTYFIFLTYLILGIYVLGVTIKTPFISLTLDTTNGQPVIIDSYYPHWAAQKILKKAISLWPLMDNQPWRIALFSYMPSFEVPIP